MALIGTLRNKMGTWVVVFVFVAIAAFVLNDILGNNSVLFGSDDVGEIAGDNISLKEYQDAILEREQSYFLNTGREPGEQERSMLQEQAWEMLIARHAIEPQYDKLGVEVTSEEVWDMIQGQNVDENLKNTPLFLNEAGEFDKDKVVAYLNQIRDLPEGSEGRVRWEIFQQSLAPSRLRLKYENLMIKSVFVTTAEAQREYHLQSDVAEIKYLYVPFYSIADSAAKVTDADFKTYYDENKERFKTEHTRDMSYVMFPVIPSQDDSLALWEDMAGLAADFRTSQNDSLFAVSNSDNPEAAYAKYTPSALPPYVSPDSLTEGKVFGPFLDANTYKVVKVINVGQDTSYTARASHILIRWENDTAEAKEQARKKAQDILNQIKNGADFAAMAREHGTDGTASRGGDLGWFSSGRMVKPFEDAVFSASKPGLVNRLVETEFGYHIIDVTNTKDNTAYTVAVIEREILPSDASINAALRKAETFQTDMSGLEEFKQRASEDGLTVMEANDITSSERRVGILGDSREIVQWLFRDASVNEVSDVFDLQDQFVVAVMTGKTEEGYKSLDDIKAEITPAVRNQVKGRIIKEKLAGLTGSLDERAQAFGNDAKVYSTSDLRLNSNSIPSVGFDPQAVGLAFGLESGNISQPVATENGVVVIELQNKTIAPEIADYSIYKTQLEQARRNNNINNLAEALKSTADIEDERYKFY